MWESQTLRFASSKEHVSNSQFQMKSQYWICFNFLICYTQKRTSKVKVLVKESLVHNSCSRWGEAWEMLCVFAVAPRRGGKSNYLISADISSHSSIICLNQGPQSIQGHV